MTQNKLNQNNSTLLYVIKDFVNERQSSNLPPQVDLDSLKSLSDAQQLSSILYCQTHLPVFQSQFASASYYSANKETIATQIHGQFASAYIDYLIFKGSEVGKYYQHPYLRMSGDIDLLVKAADKERAGKILESLGFQAPKHKSTDHEWVYTKDNYEIELHHRLLYGGDNLNDERLISFTDSIWNHAELSDGTQYHLEPESHYVFLLLHLRKHFLWAGVGIRQFMDLAVMARNSDLDWNRVDDYIKTCGIEQFAATCFALIERWFDVSIPLEKIALSDEFYEHATATVLSDGVFGDMSQKNITENEVSNAVRKKGKLQAALAVLFPPYRQMKLKYPAACQNDTVGKILLPFLWIRRFAESVFKRTAGKGLTYVGKHISNENDKRAEELKSWGLME